ncbi:MAG TPA: beta-eliminating lyase-related protein, partial [Polyangiaceae bacterium]|nr:beta-eliminating lyase-related protein [Polyangiaceae bacterium]
QAGIAAGAMLYALDHNVERLAEDHRRAARLAEALGNLASLDVSPVETNIVFLRYRRGSATQLAERLRARGVLVSHSGDRVRACTHLGISDRAVERAIQAFTEAVSA